MKYWRFTWNERGNTKIWVYRDKMTPFFKWLETSLLRLIALRVLPGPQGWRHQHPLMHYGDYITTFYMFFVFKTLALCSEFPSQYVHAVMATSAFFFFLTLIVQNSKKYWLKGKNKNFFFRLNIRNNLVWFNKKDCWPY